MASPRDSLLTLLGPIVAGEGYDLEDVEVTPAGKRRLVRVLLDQDGGLSLDDIAAISSHISAALDADDAALGSTPYVLEVSTPGVGRPLTERRHWSRATTRLVEVSLPGGELVTGRLAGVDDQGLTLEVADAAQEVAWDDVAGGRVLVDFSRRSDAESDDTEQSSVSEDTDTPAHGRA